MKFPLLDLTTIDVGDQRGTVAPPETPFETIVRGARMSWREGGLLGLIGLTPPPKPARMFDGTEYTLDPAKVARMARSTPRQR